MQRFLPLNFVPHLLFLSLVMVGCAGKSDRGATGDDIAQKEAEPPKNTKKEEVVVSPLAPYREKEVAFAGGEFACISDADPAKLQGELASQKVAHQALRIRVMQGPNEALLCQAITPHAALIAPLYRRVERPARWKTAPMGTGAFEQLAAEIRQQTPTANLGLPRVILFEDGKSRAALPHRN